MVDVAILGGGPGGYSAAFKASAAGLSTVLFEASSLGGVCLGEGCIPTKTLLRSAHLAEALREAAPLGLRLPGGEVEWDFNTLGQRRDKVIRQLRGGLEARLQKAGVDVIPARARVVGRTSEGGFRLGTDAPAAVLPQGGEVQAKWLIVATGATAAFPPIPGLDALPGGVAMGSREALSSLAPVPRRIAILGAGAVGMEFSDWYRALGAEVCVVEAAPRPLPSLDADLAAFVRRQAERKGICFHVGATVSAVEPLREGVRLRLRLAGGEEKEVEADRLLVCVGRRPATQGLGLETLGLPATGALPVDAHMQTAVPGVYAVGDVTGKCMLAHAAVREAEVAVGHLLGGKDAMRYDAIPAVLYVHPEVAGVGVSAALAQGSAATPLREARLPMGWSGRCVAEQVRAEGFCKMSCHPDGRLAGVQLAGDGSAEVIQVAALALSAGLSVRELAAMPFAHPTMGEILRETASALQQ